MFCDRCSNGWLAAGRAIAVGGLVLAVLTVPAAGAGGMRIGSSVFAAGQPIPTAFTCEGRDLSPPLTWSGVPSQARSLVLIVDDPDAPDPAAPLRTWVHWVLYNLPPSVSGLPEAVGSAALPLGTLEGVNGWERQGYRGPCPPIGRHRYFFKLYALDIVLPDLGRVSETRLMDAMAGHVVGEAQLIGTYRKGR